MSKGRYTYYKAVVELLGLRQLDVYRLQRKGALVDVLRLLDPTTRKTYNVDLGAVRESLNLKEFASRVKESLEKQGYRVNERLWKALEDRLNKLAAPSATSSSSR